MVDQDVEDNVKKDIVNVIEKSGALTALQGGAEIWSKFEQTNPELAKNIASVGNIGSAALDIFGGAEAGAITKNALKNVSEKSVSLARKGSMIAEEVGTRVNKVKNIPSDLVKAGKEFLSTDTGKAIAQTGEDIYQRFPKAKERLKEQAIQKAEKFEKLKQASPSVKGAVKSNLDEKLIKTVS